MASDHTYTIRFGIGTLMSHYLDSEFNSDYPEWVAGIRSEEYYVNMMVAWYFATALAKQYIPVLPYIENHRLAPWTHNKAIQKAIESRRLNDVQKTYLRSLKVRIIK
jgi:p-aminobenzoyl-glutamate transporter AbgT